MNYYLIYNILQFHLLLVTYHIWYHFFLVIFALTCVFSKI